MNLKHFGDSYDIVKKSLLQWLSTPPFGPWAAHPMFTHATSPAEAETFSRFLGVPLISTDVLDSASDRSRYFAACQRHGSLFLDPDTGIRVKAIEGRKASQFVFAEELIALANPRRQALILTFDQSLARGREPEQIRAKLAHFLDHDIYGFAYVSHASFIILGSSENLIRQAREQILAVSALPLHRIVTTETR
jgi:hypothetical protein